MIRFRVVTLIALLTIPSGVFAGEFDVKSLRDVGVGGGITFTPLPEPVKPVETPTFTPPLAAGAGGADPPPVGGWPAQKLCENVCDPSDSRCSGYREDDCPSYCKMRRVCIKP